MITTVSLNEVMTSLALIIARHVITVITSLMVNWLVFSAEWRVEMIVMLSRVPREIKELANLSFAFKL